MGLLDDWGPLKACAIPNRMVRRLKTASRRSNEVICADERCAITVRRHAKSRIFTAAAAYDDAELDGPGGLVDCGPLQACARPNRAGQNRAGKKAD